MMSETMTDVEIMLIDIRGEITGIRTDVSWLKRIFGVCVILCGAVVGVDVSGAI